MKQRLSLIFSFLLLAAFAMAQSMSLSDSPVSGTANLDDMSTNPDDVEAHTTITNNTNQTITLRWERVTNDTPDGWNTAVCDLNQCYFHTVSEQEFEMQPNESGELIVHAYPGGGPGQLDSALPGNGTVELKIVNVDDETDFIMGVFNFTVTGEAIVSISDLEKAAISLYPNPTTDFFRLEGSEHVSNLVVYNILGPSGTRL